MTDAAAGIASAFGAGAGASGTVFSGAGTGAGGGAAAGSAACAAEEGAGCRGSFVPDMGSFRIGAWGEGPPDGQSSSGAGGVVVNRSPSKYTVRGVPPAGPNSRTSPPPGGTRRIRLPVSRATRAARVRT